MGNLSQHFNRWEFKCRCGECAQDAVDAKLIEVLERLRTTVSSPITITSGNRCPAHNKRIGGSPRSQHVFSKAADFQTKGWSPSEIYKLLDEWYPDQFGLGIYRTWVHLDVRDQKARWDNR